MDNANMVTIPPQNVTVSGRYDVVVCGGGPAGIAAAVAAGQLGARTLLIEHLSTIGGMGTAAFVNGWVDTPGGPIFDELLRRIEACGCLTRHYDEQRHQYPGRAGFHGETLKPIALRMVSQAGAEVLFCTTAEAAWVPDDTVRGVFIANKGGRSLIRAAVLIDATADGDIAASAGAQFAKGDPEDGRLQHVNFKFRIEAADKDDYQRREPSEEDLIALIRAAHRSGDIHPPDGVFRPRPELFPYHRPEQALVLSTWEIENVDPTDPLQVSTTLTQCQLAAYEVVEFARRHLPGYQHARLGRLPELLGTRESRRITGNYTLTSDDVLSAAKFDDAVARACFFMDLHDSPPGTSIPFSLEHVWANRPPRDDYYEVPYRCLVPVGVGGMLVAGRCISADRAAGGSLRVMPTCMFTGAAAGTAAAMAVSTGVPPHQLDGRDVRAQILND